MLASSITRSPYSLPRGPAPGPAPDDARRLVRGDSRGPGPYPACPAARWLPEGEGPGGKFVVGFLSSRAGRLELRGIAGSRDGGRKQLRGGRIPGWRSVGGGKGKKMPMGAEGRGPVILWQP